MSTALARLRAAAERMGHAPGCDATTVFAGFVPEKPCSCGFDSLLSVFSEVEREQAIEQNERNQWEKFAREAALKAERLEREQGEDTELLDWWDQHMNVMSDGLSVRERMRKDRAAVDAARGQDAG